MDNEARLEGYYNSYQKNKNKLKIADWIVVDEEYYLANKDKINIINDISGFNLISSWENLEKKVQSSFRYIDDILENNILKKI